MIILVTTTAPQSQVGRSSPARFRAPVLEARFTHPFNVSHIHLTLLAVKNIISFHIIIIAEWYKYMLHQLKNSYRANEMFTICTCETIFRPTDINNAIFFPGEVTSSSRPHSDKLRLTLQVPRYSSISRRPLWMTSSHYKVAQNNRLPVKLWDKNVYNFLIKTVAVAVLPPSGARTSAGTGVRKHYSDVIMSAIASQITSPTIVYTTVYSGANQRKHQSFASLAFVRGIHRWPVNSPHKRPVTRKMSPFYDVIMVRVLYMYAGQELEELKGWNLNEMSDI